MARLTHLDDKGRAQMVDVGEKTPSRRTAIAKGRLVMNEQTLKLLMSSSGPKGDALAAARIAGIMAAKRTGDLIPLCHPLPLDSVSIEIERIAPDQVEVTGTAQTTAKTGVEMEALTAVSVAALTLYDMLKSSEKGIRITDIRLVSKTGGKSGDYRAS